jgi:hypothetical protein
MKNPRVRTTADRKPLREKLLSIAAKAFAVVMIVLLALLVWQKANQHVDTSDYEGKIVDRWADYPESKYVSQPRFHLRVESQDGKQFTIKVDPNVYESARIGMRIKSRSGQIVLIDSEQRAIGK